MQDRSKAGDAGQFGAVPASTHGDAGVGGAVTSAAAGFPSPNPLFKGCPGLFLQTNGSLTDLRAAARLVQAEGMGIVFTLDTRVKHTVSRLRELADEHRRTVGPLEHVLLDANRYSGKNRKTKTRLDPNWIKAQHGAGIRVALTDSPYLPAGDCKTLVSTLDQAAGFGDGVVAVLPLHLDWLTKKADRAQLLQAINQAGVSVALILEHDHDPLGVQAAVAGLVQLLANAKVKVGLLRCDLSVIGAVAFGAAFGAVGVSTGLRHIYPLGKGGGGGHEPSIAALVARPMVYRSLAKINAAIAADPDNQDRWRCACRFCYDRMLSYIVDETQAYQHSLAAIAALGRDVLSGETQLERQHAWVRACLLAQTVNLEIASDTGLSWEPPKFQGAWHKLAAQLPALRPAPA